MSRVLTTDEADRCLMTELRALRIQLQVFRAWIVNVEFETRQRGIEDIIEDMAIDILPPRFRTRLLIELFQQFARRLEQISERERKDFFFDSLVKLTEQLEQGAKTCFERKTLFQGNPRVQIGPSMQRSK